MIDETKGEVNAEDLVEGLMDASMFEQILAAYVSWTDTIQDQKVIMEQNKIDAHTLQVCKNVLFEIMKQYLDPSAEKPMLTDDAKATLESDYSKDEAERVGK